MLKGYVTYIAAAGLLLGGIAKIINGDIATGVTEIVAALAVFGLRRSNGELEMQLAEIQEEQANVTDALANAGVEEETYEKV